jgi:replicative DNA helicase
MLDPRIVGRFGVVLAGKFYRHDHNELWSLLVAMMNADIPIEPVVSVPYEMQRLGPARFGGHAYVCCALIDAALPSASMAHYVGIVIDAARRRALIEACEVAADNACTSDDVGEVVARLLASLDGLVDV